MNTNGLDLNECFGDEEAEWWPLNPIGAEINGGMPAISWEEYNEALGSVQPWGLTPPAAAVAQSNNDQQQLNPDHHPAEPQSGTLTGVGITGGSNDNNSRVAGVGDGGGRGKESLKVKHVKVEKKYRKKLNDSLYRLRSAVPKITKMDRMSILGDAKAYIKELSQKIDELETEISPYPSPSASTHQNHLLPSSSATIPSSFQGQFSSPPARSRVEVSVCGGRAVNIHMFCPRKPGLLQSTMGAMDNLGLDIQHAVISCFNGFNLDVLQANPCVLGQELNPKHIKQALMNAADL